MELLELSTGKPFKKSFNGKTKEKIYFKVEIRDFDSLIDFASALKHEATIDLALKLNGILRKIVRYNAVKK